ncbi:MAG: prolipoprotein diacylglyceryl transferase [Novosphingobium sp.]
MLSLLLAAASQPIYFEDLGLTRGISIGSFMLRWYSLAYLAGIIFAYWHTIKAIRTPGAPLAQRHADDLFFYCTLGIIIGGRLGYALFYTGGNTGVPSILTHFTPGEGISWDLLRLWDGGMSFHGGLVGVMLAMMWVSWRGKLQMLRVFDYISVSVPAGMLFGRLANFVNGELWGRPAGPDVPWAIVFREAGPEARHPSQLYEAGLEGALLLVVMLFLFWKTRARFRPGLLTGVFAAGIAGGRFVVEFFREPDSQLRAFAMETGLSMGQWLTLPLFLGGMFFLIRSLIRPPLGSASAAAAQ